VFTGFLGVYPCMGGIRAAGCGCVGERPSRVGCCASAEVYELRRANEILKAASVFFATELDQDRTK
jgi:hypothetical protein